MSANRRILKQVGSNLFWSILAEILAKGVLLVMHLVWARQLGASGYGLLATTITILNFVWISVDLGTTMYGIRTVANADTNEDKREITANLLGMRLSAGLLVTATVIWVANFFPIEEERRSMIVMGSGYLLFYAWCMDWLMKALNQFSKAFFIVLANYATLAVVYFCYYFLHPGIKDSEIVIFIWAWSFISGAMLSVYLTKVVLKGLLWPKFNFNSWLLHCRHSIYFTLGGLAVLATQSLPIFASMYFSPLEEQGLFIAAYRLTSTLNSAAFLLPTAIFPILSSLFVSNRLQYLAMLKFTRIVMFFSATILAAILYVGADQIILLLYGKDYQGSILVLKILSISIVPTFLRYSVGVAINASGGQRYTFFCSVIALLATTLTLLLLLTFLNNRLLSFACSIVVGELTYYVSMETTLRLHLKN